MSNLAKLSKQALQHEHDRQYEKALALYSRLFDEAASADEEVDVALFNRAGDAAMRVGDAPTAVRYYERAVDAYALGGLLNNAIAVCNKLLRHAPEHAATHHTLGVLHAKQGFRGDAKHHFVEYADRMHRAGRDDEALRALSEFAALCPAGDDTRAALAQYLAKGNRGAESVAKLTALLGEPHAEHAPEPVATRPSMPTPVTSAPAVSSTPTAPVVEERRAQLVFLDVSVDGLESAPAPGGAPETAPFVVPGLELTSALAAAPGEVPPEPTPALLDFEYEPTALSPEPASVQFEPALAFEPSVVDLDLASPDEDAVFLDLDAPLADLALDAPEPSIDDDVLVLASAAAGDVPHVSSPRWFAELPGELPMLSLGGWIGSAGAVGVCDEPAVAAAPTAPVVAPNEDFVDLGAWLRETEPTPSTRMTSNDATPTGDEAADFERLLGAFRTGVDRNVDVEDFDSHYDLGVAYREMGLVDDAIAEFQKAAHAPHGGLRAREALGQCFLDRGSPELVVATLEHDAEPLGDADAAVNDSSLLGVLYLLGVAHAQLGATERARRCYQRVVAADIRFRDAAARLSKLSAPSP